MKKSGWIFSVFIISFLMIGSGAPSASAFGKCGVITNAEKLYEIGDYNLASESLVEAIKKGEVPEREWADAYKLLGDIYKKMGRNSDAKKAYRYAVITEGTGYREGQSLLNLDVKNLEAIFPKLMENTKNNDKLRANYGADIAQLAKNELIAERADNADKLYNFSFRIDPNPARQKEAFDRFFEIGKQKKGNEAANYADKAVKYASTQEAKEKAGKLYLKAATEIWPDKYYEAAKNKAIPLVGIEFVSKYFTYQQKVIFKRTYTDRNANSRGHIKTFSWDDQTKKGDLVQLEVKIEGKPGETDRFGLYLGDDKQGNAIWIAKEGVIEQPVNDTVPYGKNQMCVVAINLKKNVQLTVKIYRKVEQPTNLQIEI
jgi:hypothetical protein